MKAAPIIRACVLILTFAVPALGAEVDRREARQQQRIAEGVENGSLSPRETAKLERRETKIHREIKRDRAANGGHLTPAERAKIDAILAGVAGRVREFTPLRPAMEPWGEEVRAI